MIITSKALIKSFLVNLFLSIIKIVTGWFGKSSALIADGVHSFSDLMTDFVAIFGNRYAMKPADKEHPFGHGKIEYLTCLIIGFIVLILGFEIINSAFKEDIIVPSKLVIVVSMITIIIKFILSSYLIKTGKKHSNAILIASGKESSMDVISSFFVLLSSILMQFSSEIYILKYSNSVATILVGILIIKTGFNVLKENMSSILGEQENDVNTKQMIEILKQQEKIKNIDSFNVIKNGPYFQITGEVSMDENMTLREVHDIIEEIEKNLKKQDERARYINIHVNPTK